MDPQSPPNSPLLPPLPQSAGTFTPSVKSLLSSSPTPEPAIIAHEIPFCGYQAFISYYPEDRVAIFKQRYYTFVYVVDKGLSHELYRLTLFDGEKWHYNDDHCVYRLADIVYLLHRLCQEVDPPRDQNVGDLAMLNKALENQVDRMSLARVQIELGVTREICTGPNEALLYYFWCHIVLYLGERKTILVCVNSEGRVCPSGDPKLARIHNVRRSGSGLILCVGWHWGADFVQVWNAENLNSHGIYFSDPRIQQPLLLRGWSASRYTLTASQSVAETLKWRQRPQSQNQIAT